jgi:L-rhamnose isomerase/sugar isomerase
LHTIDIDARLAEAITIWLADGSNYPDRCRPVQPIASCRLGDVYRALPSGWRLFIEHKPYEPAFYATVIQDWGRHCVAQQLGEQAQCLVDLGHHLPNTNIELIVARLVGAASSAVLLQRFEIRRRRSHRRLHQTVRPISDLP